MRIIPCEQHGKYRNQGDRRACHSERSEESMCLAENDPARRFFAALRMTGERVSVRQKPAPARAFAVALLLLLLTISLVACDGPTINFGATSTPTTTGLPGNAQFNTWYAAAPGISVRYEDWKTADSDDDTITIVRIDPRSVTLSIGYQPNKPLLMSQWMKQEGAAAIINGGYFDQNDQATALVISNGQTYSSTYTGFGGMLSMDSNGHIALRSLRQQPYDPGESLVQATQCSPMLVEGGKRTQFNADPSQSRRSIVAMDKNGNLLFISSPDEVFTLDQIADLLVSSDLSITTALNLDGGASTGLYVNGSAQTHVTIDSYVLLPLVVIIKEK